MEPGAFSRRDLFRKSLVLSGLAAGGRVLAACAPEAREPGRFLSKSKFAILTAVADAFVPRGGAFAAGALDAGVPALLDKRMAGEPRGVQSQFVAALTALEYMAVLYEGAPFTELPPDKRQHYFLLLQASRFETPRLIVQGLARGVYFTFYDTAVAWPSIGYEGPWIQAVTP
jgi:hypothetical protein